MQGLMMDYPLTLTQFFERSRRLFANKTLVTRVPGHPLVRYTYADCAERVARLAGGLAALGISPGDRVGTFAWNTHHNLEAYWAVPMMGAVLHTVNFRLSPQDMTYIINHSGSRRSVSVRDVTFPPCAAFQSAAPRPPRASSKPTISS